MNSADSLAPSSRRLLLDATHAADCRLVERVQSLWSGYGSILRIEALGGRLRSPLSVIVKEVRPPGGRQGGGSSHPRGWDSGQSHQRKLRSYAAEMHFYANQQRYTDQNSRVPAALGLDEHDDGWCFIFEDLDAAGFAERRSTLSPVQCRPVLRWLAQFHARNLSDRRGCAADSSSASAVPREKKENAAVSGLWERGTYWHLATRPDELEVLQHRALREHASALDERLARARFWTVVHGDAKVANFCFSNDLRQVAAVDFQYVGGGVGAQDLAYFLSSCMGERQLRRHAPKLVDLYFQELKRAIDERNASQRDSSLREDSPENGVLVDPAAVEEEWRALYPVAWADFLRFLLGWAPGHSKVHGYSLDQVQQALGAGCPVSGRAP